MRSLRNWGAALALAVASAGTAAAQDKVTFGTDWKAQAEHGGFYQAIAAGIYKKYGLDGNTAPGRAAGEPRAASRWPGGVDINHDAGFLRALTTTCKREHPDAGGRRRMFQKDPQVIISHPGVGNDSLEELKGKPILIGAGGRATVLAVPQGEVRLHRRADPSLYLQRGAVPRRQERWPAGLPDQRAATPIEKAGGKPVAHLIADAGFGSYDAIIADLAEAGRPRSRTWSSASSTPRSRAGTSYTQRRLRHRRPMGSSRKTTRT